MGKFNGRRSDGTGRILPLKSGASRFGLSEGWTMVDFAMVAPLFLFLLFAVMDYGWLMFAQMNVQQAVQDGGRFASTGNHSTDSSGDTLTRIQSIINTIQNEISVPGVNVQQNLQICSLSGGCTGAGAAGGPGDTVTLKLTTSLPLMTPVISRLFSGGVYTFTSSTSFKNEPFNPANTD
jgi:Flp pilus assembly protein TadG